MNLWLVAAVDGRQINGRLAGVVVPRSRHRLHGGLGGRKRALFDIAVAVVPPGASVDRPLAQIVEPLHRQPRPAHVAGRLLLDVLPARATFAARDPQQGFGACPQGVDVRVVDFLVELRGAGGGQRLLDRGLAIDGVRLAVLGLGRGHLQGDRQQSGVAGLGIAARIIDAVEQAGQGRMELELRLPGFLVQFDDIR